MKCFRALAGAIVLTILCSIPALADENATELPEMVVTATGRPTAQKDLPVPSQIITSEEIELSGADDLSELLARYVPGHVQSYYPGGTNAVGIRGFRSYWGAGPDLKSKVLILINGNRAGTGNLSIIPLDNVERIEVVRGPGSVLYGASAMGGVINVITRKGKGKPGVNVGGEAGSFSKVQAKGSSQGEFMDGRMSYSIAGRTIQRGNFHKGGGGAISNTKYNDGAAGASITGEIAKGHTITVDGNYFSAWDVGSPGPDYSHSDEDTYDNIHQYLSATYDGGLESIDTNWHLSTYLVNKQYTWNNGENSWGGAYKSKQDTTTKGVRANVDLPTLSFGRLLAGIDYDNIEDRNTSNPTGNIWTPDTDYDIYGLFAEERVWLGDVTLYAGGRYDNYNEKIKSTDGMEKVDAGTKNFDHLSWRTGAVYDAVDWLAFRAAVGTAFRPPVAEELTGEYIASGMKYRGNPDLDPETSITCEGGADIFFRGFKAGVTYFYTRSDDTIVTDSLADGWTSYQNIEGLDLQALEWSADYIHKFDAYGQNLSLNPYMNGIYYFQRKNRDEDTSDSWKTSTAPFIPQFSITAGLATQLAKLVNLDVNFTYMGREKQQQYDFSSPDYGQAINTGDFALLNARLTVTPVENLKTFLAVDNIADQDYEYVAGYPMPGRSFTLGVEFIF